MTNLISQAFKNDQKKLVTFVTGGDPDFETSLQIIRTIIKIRIISQCPSPNINFVSKLILQDNRF